MGDLSGREPFSRLSYLSYWFKLLLSLFLSSLLRLRTFSGSTHPLHIWGASRADQTRATRSLVLTDIVEWTSTSPYRGQHREFKVKRRREQSNSKKGRESHRSSPRGAYNQPINALTKDQLLDSWQSISKAKYELSEPSRQRIRRERKYHKTIFIVTKYALQVNIHVAQPSHL